MPDGVHGLLNEIRHISTSGPPKSNGRFCFEVLDLCGCGIDDAGVVRLCEFLRQMQVATRRLLLSGNGLGDVAMASLAGYFWHSPEPLWELALADNNLTGQGVEELLRCLYNHANHPPRLPGATGADGPAFPLRLDLRNNMVQGQDTLLRRVESAGSHGRVQLCVTPGDGPAPPPVEANRPLPYLWVFLPRLKEQRTPKIERREKGSREKGGREREKNDEKDRKKNRGKVSKDHSAREPRNAKEKAKDREKQKGKGKHDKRERGNAPAEKIEKTERAIAAKAARVAKAVKAEKRPSRSPSRYQPSGAPQRSSGPHGCPLSTGVAPNGNRSRSPSRYQPSGAPRRHSGSSGSGTSSRSRARGSNSCDDSRSRSRSARRSRSRSTPRKATSNGCHVTVVKAELDRSSSSSTVASSSSRRSRHHRRRRDGSGPPPGLRAWLP